MSSATQEQLAKVLLMTTPLICLSEHCTLGGQGSCRRATLIHVSEATPCPSWFSFGPGHYENTRLNKSVVWRAVCFREYIGSRPNTKGSRRSLAAMNRPLSSTFGRKAVIMANPSTTLQVGIYSTWKRRTSLASDMNKLNNLGTNRDDGSNDEIVEASYHRQIDIILISYLTSRTSPL